MLKIKNGDVLELNNGVITRKVRVHKKDNKLVMYDLKRGYTIGAVSAFPRKQMKLL